MDMPKICSWGFVNFFLFFVLWHHEVRFFCEICSKPQFTKVRPETLQICITTKELKIMKY